MCKWISVWYLVPSKSVVCEQVYIWVYVDICICLSTAFAHDAPAFIRNRKWRFIYFLISSTRWHTTYEQELWLNHFCINGSSLVWYLPCPVAEDELIQKVMPCCYSLCLRNLLIMKQLFANSEPGKRWQYTGRAKEGSGTWNQREGSCGGCRASQSLVVGWKKSRAWESQLSPRHLHCRRDIWARSSNPLSSTCTYIPSPTTMPPVLWDCLSKHFSSSPAFRTFFLIT